MKSFVFFSPSLQRVLSGFSAYVSFSQRMKLMVSSVDFLALDLSQSDFLRRTGQLKKSLRNLHLSEKTFLPTVHNSLHRKDSL